ncbi:MAG TPA: bifunctional diguanylate cyclase/phosphodiesterase, partial [Methylococcaceae bacterium]|nr:bifunctional diguanylate cyclase/phosphodiesterase [Methylococcaceae bacterium]
MRQNALSLANAYPVGYEDEGRFTPLLDRILQDGLLTAAFQPIVCPLRKEIFGYEGLIRGPADTPLHYPAPLFEEASRQQRLLELDLLCRRTIIGQFAQLGLPGALFVNVSPLTLLYEDFTNGQTLHFLNEARLDPSRVIIEITETHHIEDINLLQNALLHYRDMGFRVALDDLGAGYSGLTLWSQMNPDFVKIDRHFIQGVDDNKTKRQFIKSIIEIARSLGCKTITEGIETGSECRTLCALGANLLQGYFFDVPSTLPRTGLDPVHAGPLKGKAMPSHRLTAACLMSPLAQVPGHMTLEKVGDLFGASPDMPSVAVVHHDEVLGLVLRKDLLNLLAVRFGREIYGRKPIRKFTNRTVMTVEIDTPLDKISQYLANAIDHYTDEFIITEMGRCAGKGTLIDLLRRFTEQQVYIARYANPLTLLPGNLMIQNTLEQALEETAAFTVTHFDIDDFKPFNDRYGHAQGDEVIEWLANMLTGEAGTEDFVGHVGGDDFIVLTRDDDWPERCRRVLRRFGTEIARFYVDSDRSRDGIEAEDR